MSEPSALQKLVHRRFREVFGEPNSFLDPDDHWSLMPATPHSAAINVLIQGDDKPLAIWVFDPHAPDDDVMPVAINDERTIEETIVKIQERFKNASLPRGG